MDGAGAIHGGIIQMEVVQTFAGVDVDLNVISIRQRVSVPSGSVIITNQSKSIIL